MQQAISTEYPAQHVNAFTLRKRKRLVLLVGLTIFLPLVLWFV
jgi:hypothetical protein